MVDGWKKDEGWLRHVSCSVDMGVVGQRQEGRKDGGDMSAAV